MRPPVVFDIDGTLCFDGVSIDAPILDALRELRSTAEVVFASARPIRDLLPVLPADLHDAVLIGGNGAFVRRDGNLTVHGIDPADRQLIDELIDRRGLAVLIDGDWDYSFTGDESRRIFTQLDAGKLATNVTRDRIEHYSKVVLFTADPHVVEEVRRTSLSVTVHPDEQIVDIAPSGVTKYHALGRSGMADFEYDAFGNDANDELMLRGARVSYCVGEHPALAFADHHLARHGVEQAIRGLSTD